MRGKLIEPTIDQILRYCAEAPVERVFLEDVARRGFGYRRHLVQSTAHLLKLVGARRIEHAGALAKALDERRRFRKGAQERVGEDGDSAWPRDHLLESCLGLAIDLAQLLDCTVDEAQRRL